MIKKILNDAFKNKSLVGIRTRNEDWNEVLIGFITELNDSYLEMNEVDEDAALIGKTVISLDDIISLDFNDRYQKRLKLIYDKKSLIDPDKRISVKKLGPELTDYFSLLVKSKGIATIDFDEDNYVIGIVKSFDDNCILINNIGIEGDDDGTSCHFIDKIVGITFAGVEEQKVRILYDNSALFY